LTALKELHQAQFEAKIHKIISDLCLANYPKTRLGLESLGSSYCDTKVEMTDRADTAIAVANGLWRTIQIKRDRLYTEYVKALPASIEASLNEKLFLAKVFIQEKERLLREGIISQKEIEEYQTIIDTPDKRILTKTQDMIAERTKAYKPEYRDELNNNLQDNLAKIGVESLGVQNGSLPDDDYLDRVIVELANKYGFKKFRTARGSKEELQKAIEAAEEADFVAAQEVETVKRELKQKDIIEKLLTLEERNELVIKNKTKRNNLYADLKESYHEIIQAYFVFYVTTALYKEVGEIRHLNTLENGKYKSEYDRKFAAFSKAEAEKESTEAKFKNNLELLNNLVKLIDGYEQGTKKKEIDGDEFKREWSLQMERDLYKRVDTKGKGTDGILAIMERWISWRLKDKAAGFLLAIHKEYEKLIKSNYDIPDEVVNNLIKNIAEEVSIDLCDKKLFCDNKVIEPYDGLVGFNIEDYQPPRTAPAAKGALGLGFFGLGGSRKVRRESSRKTLKKRRSVV